MQGGGGDDEVGGVSQNIVLLSINCCGTIYGMHKKKKR